ncbi:hypothetical protein [Flavobacterium daejeonense]|uniref:hypothetical protein n=1 Tax=Flavobacterium daejeonense TaxID=350893 RepID=UPI000A3EF014|nr:hypothetical protein [Flavobacterium daejeonense]
MKNLKGIISIIGVIIKYAAVFTAVIKGLQLVADELDKIDLGNEETPVKKRIEVKDE